MGAGGQVLGAQKREQLATEHRVGDGSKWVRLRRMSRSLQVEQDLAIVPFWDVVWMEVWESMYPAEPQGTERGLS